MELLFIIACIFGLIGYNMGERRGIPIIGLILGFCLGVIGLILLLIVPKNLNK